MSKNRKLDMDSLTSMIKKTVRNDDDRKKALEEFEEEFYGKKKNSKQKLLKPEKRLRKSNLSAENDTFSVFLSRKDLTSTEKLMLIFISHASTDKEGMSISVRALASSLGINKNTALDTLISLELKGIIEKKSTPRGTMVKLLVSVGIP
ncbi:hypothetical protein AT15_07565 [Kosmotoga arenicorallina S304]|uniref:LexA repressor DNA-binding domain-containing protein n=1 Tax=Kosmotoga arenicorallina S304 TaxID=1453497 RepID=A0A176K2B3_9BACT|nr:hypothetical protein [Kosmotoga arenicorallina]OAA31346.1 hypothetical protein AT15_07565 [Kosmotoga arenicorallina S304]